MKISNLALPSLLLLLGIQSNTNAFQPAIQQQPAFRRNIISFNSRQPLEINKCKADYAQFSLSYPPISLFGKDASANQSYPNPKDLLGGKGANLAQMSKFGLSVPPGFTLTTESCSLYCNDSKWKSKIPAEIWDDVLSSVGFIEDAMDSQFGSPSNPLLLSVRSGAAISMPGMMVRSYVFFLVTFFILLPAILEVVVVILFFFMTVM